MRRFTYKSLDEIEEAARELGCDSVRFEHDPASIRETLARPVQAGPVRIGNSICVHPMEGCDGELDGRPGDLTWRRYDRYARGGAKLIWFEATAVREDGRANTRQLWIRDQNWEDYARLLDMLRRKHRETYGTDDDLLAPIQLTHSGRYSVPRPVIAYRNPLVDRKFGLAPGYDVIGDSELERLEDDYVAAARLAVRAGFRAIDIKVTHGYLLSELSGAKQREGRYGGPLENRIRMPLNIAGKIRDALGPDVLLCMRLGCFEGVPYVTDPATRLGVPIPYPVPYPHGFGVNAMNPLEPDVAEVKDAIRMFRDAGVRLFNLSLGVPYFNPHIGRPFETPDDGNYEQPEHPLRGVNRHFAVAGELQRAFPDLAMTSAGYSWLQIYQIHAGAKNIQDGNIRIFGTGRNTLAYPDFARDALETGALDERRVCKTLTYCTFLMRQKDNPLGQFPTGCPPFDKEAYGPIIKQARAAQRARKAQPQ
jgi:2,4-dienoyl-CoA reductase-like NADH-dependent reductase (Old Yellow Enzyme family)